MTQAPSVATPLVNHPGRRHDFVLLFDVADGNPNGDPDAGNLPRVDPETMQGLVTDVAIKRKVRDFVDIARGSEPRFKIYVQHDAYLTDTRARVFGERASGRADKDVPPTEARDWMCDEFFDVRMFGAVMSMTEKNAGQVRGPLQLTFARSVDPIIPLDEAIVGPAQNQRQARRSEDDDRDAFGTMGRKSVVPYALYRAHGFFNPHFAERNQVAETDLEVFWQALSGAMWDMTRSASRGLMSTRGLFVFSHDNRLGYAPAQDLFELIDVPPRVTSGALAPTTLGATPPRKFSDYTVEVNESGLPEGVTLTRLVG